MRKTVLIIIIIFFVLLVNPISASAQCTGNPCSWQNICTWGSCSPLTPGCGTNGFKTTCNNTYVCLPQCATQGSTTTVTPGSTTRETTNNNNGGSSTPATGWCGQASCPQAWCGDVACIGANPSINEPGGCFSASSWNSGGRDRCSNDGCCGGGPPPVFGCNGNSCTEQSSGSGPYENDNSCAGRCGNISLTNKTTLTKSASQRNSLACNGTNGTPNLERSSSNKTNNPALFNIDASVEETDPGTYQRSWNVKKIDFSGGTIPATTIWNNGAYVSNPYASFFANPGVGYGSSEGGGFTYRTINAAIVFDLNMTNNGYTTTAGVSCDNSLTFTSREQIGGSSGNLSAVTGSKEIFRYGCNSAKPAQNPIDYTTLKSNLITETVNKLNGGTNNGTNTYRWGVFSKDVNNVVTELSGKGLELSITEGYYKLKTIGGTETVWVTGNENTYNNLPAEAIDQKYYFYVNFKLNNTLTPPISTSLVTCAKFMLPLSSDQSLMVYQLTCTIDKSFPLAGNTTNASSSDDYGFKEFYRDLLNNNGMVGFTYQGTDFHKINNTETGFFAYMDSNQVLNFYTNTSSPRETDYHRILSSNFPVQYIGDPSSNVARLTFDLEFKDGIPYGNYNLAVTISDGYGPNPKQSTINITHTVDTYLPVVEREVTVDSATLLKVVDKAEDDHQLKSHALYCAPTSINSTISPYISESRNGQALGVEQIAGYFDADPNVKTCNGVMANNTGDFKVFNTTAVSDTRSTYYLLDESKLKNQNEPYEITFGDGKDGSALGKWYAEDSFCNLPASSPTTSIDIGSPWLQTKGGNTYVQGTNGASRLNTGTQAYNYTVNNVAIAPDPNNPALNICSSSIGSVTNNNLRNYISSKNTKSNAALTSYVNRINQCPENTDAYVSTYALSSNENSEGSGPKGNTDRFSKISQSAVEYNHKLNNVSNYTGGDKTLFDYLSKLVDTSGIIGYSQNNTEVTTDDVIIDDRSPIYAGTEGLAINSINNSVNVDPRADGDLITELGSSITVVSAPVTVFKINGNLNVKYNAANNGIWSIEKSAIILVDGNVTLEPDIIKNRGSLIIVAKGSIVIGSGKYKSSAFTKDQVVAGTAYPLYDEIDAFLITDGKLITLPDKGGSSNISITSNPIKPPETVATKPEVKLNNEIIKKVSAVDYPCTVRYFRNADFTGEFVNNESIPINTDIYIAVARTGAGTDTFQTGVNSPSMKIGSTRVPGLHTIGNNYYGTIAGNLIQLGTNTIQWGFNVDFNTLVGDWCNPVILTGVPVSNPCKVSFYKDAAFTQPFTAGENVTSNQSISLYMHRSLNGAFSNYLWGSVSARVNGSGISNLQQITFNGEIQYLGTHTMVEGDNIIQFGVDMRGASSAYDATNPGSNTAWCEPFTLVGQTVSAPVTQCTAMTINGGNEDVAITPGTDITISMTVSNPLSNSGSIVLNNRDNKCTDTRAFRAGLTATNSYGSSYSVMSNSTNPISNWQECVLPPTNPLNTTVFEYSSPYSDNGNSRTYSYKIKAEQLLKTDSNTGLPIKSIEFMGPNIVDESLRCKVYAHDNRIVYDGLKIYGGVVQTSTFPKGMTLGGNLGIDMDGDGVNESDLTCKSSGGSYPTTQTQSVVTGTASPCFLRDLIMVQNFVAPAEQIEYDPNIQLMFGSVLGRKSTLLSIRESTTND